MASCLNIVFYFQGKQVIRPIAFRPVPGSGASTPTNGSSLGVFRPASQTSASGQTTPSAAFDSQPSPAPHPPFASGHVVIGGPGAGPAPNGVSVNGGLLSATKPNEGFAPGHPLVKDGRRHYGSKRSYLLYAQFKRLPQDISEPRLQWLKLTYRPSSITNNLSKN